MTIYQNQLQQEPIRSRPAITSSIWPDDLRAKIASEEGGVLSVRRAESEVVLDVKGWSDDEVIAGRLLNPSLIICKVYENEK